MNRYRYQARDEEVRKNDGTGVYRYLPRLAHTVMLGDREVFNGDDEVAAQKFVIFLNMLSPEQAKSIIDGTHEVGMREHVVNMQRRRLTPASGDFVPRRS